MNPLDVEPKDAWVMAMVWAQTQVVRYAPAEHLDLAMGLTAGAFWCAYQAFKRYHDNGTQT